MVLGTITIAMVPVCLARANLTEQQDVRAAGRPEAAALLLFGAVVIGNHGLFCVLRFSMRTLSKGLSQKGLRPFADGFLQDCYIYS